MSSLELLSYCGRAVDAKCFRVFNVDETIEIISVELFCIFGRKTLFDLVLFSAMMVTQSK